MLNIVKNYLTKNRCYQQNVKRKPIGIQIHTIGCAQGTANAVADCWNQAGVDACVTYICDCDTPGKVLKLLDEDVYTWADAGFGNRNLITIEICESDFMRYISGASYEVTNKARFEADILRGYDTAVALCADICKRYGWDPNSKLSNGLHLISSHDEGRQAGLSSAHVDPTHIWPRLNLSMDTFRNSVAVAMAADDVAFTEPETKYYRVRKKWTDPDTQLGAYLIFENAKAACPYLYSVFDENGFAVYSNKTKPKGGTQASEFKGLSEDVVASKMLEIVHATDISGILNSVTTAQMILESGYGKTNLAQIANNFFGMKANLSGNTWASEWDGKTVTTPTWEVYDGKTVNIDADFRKYPDVEASIRDHSAYLLGAKNDSKLRYAGLLDAKDYKAAIAIIKNGGYATDPNYVSKICSIVQRFGLNKYDPVVEEEKVEPTQPEKNVIYRAQVGSYSRKVNALKRQTAVEEKSGFKVVIEKSGDRYLAFCGSFKKKANAAKRISKLKKLGIDCFLAEVEV